MLQIYQSKPHVEDPTPAVPECLKDPLWVVPELNEIHRRHVPSDGADEDRAVPTEDEQTDTQETTCTTPVDSSGTAKSPRTPRWSGGNSLAKTVVATRCGYDHLGLALAGETFARGFNKAKFKAFMEAKKEEVPKAIRRAITYLGNNAVRMKYDQ